MRVRTSTLVAPIAQGALSQGIGLPTVAVPRPSDRLAPDQQYGPFLGAVMQHRRILWTGHVELAPKVERHPLTLHTPDSVCPALATQQNHSTRSPGMMVRPFALNRLLNFQSARSCITLLLLLPLGFFMVCSGAVVGMNEL